MRKKTICLSVILHVLCHLWSHSQTYINNVVRIETSDISGEYSQIGTGFAVGINGTELYIATAYHVLQDASEFRVYFQNSGGKAYEGELLADNIAPTSDFAILTVDIGVDYISPERIKVIDPYTIKRGLPITVAGTPGATQRKLEVNTRNSLIHLTNTQGIFTFTNDGIIPGFSGAPVFNRKKHLMGFVLNRNAIEVSAIDIKQVIYYLENWGINYRYLRAYKRQLHPWTFPLAGASLGSLGLAIYTQQDVKDRHAIYVANLDPTSPVYTDPEHPDYLGRRRAEVLDNLRNRERFMQNGAYVLSGLLAATAIWINVKKRKSPYSQRTVARGSLFPQVDYLESTNAMNVRLNFMLRF